MMSVSSVTASPSPPPPPPPAKPPVDAKAEETNVNAVQAKDDAEAKTSATENSSQASPKAPLPPGQGTRVDIIA
uniref:Formin n=1 Tax=Rhodopseudomonas palustris (strain BisA53) TaxID=316055 RepID=Q07RC0_RHOP5